MLMARPLHDLPGSISPQRPGYHFPIWKWLANFCSHGLGFSELVNSSPQNIEHHCYGREHIGKHT